MAPPSPSHTQPSKEKEDNEPYPQDDEEESSEEEPERKEKSSGEEEDGSSEEEESDGDEEREPKIQTPQPKSLSRTEEEDGSDSEPESDASPSQFKLQPITKQPAPVAKRARQGDDSDQDSSRSEKKMKAEEKKSAPTSISAASGGGCITRLWTEEDEIVLLKGMVYFKSQKEVDPYADMGVFYDYIKQKLQVGFSKAQMSSKISRMKKRFFNALEKGENGEDPVFSKPHEFKAFELSKKIWGGAIEKSKGSKHSNTNGVVQDVRKDNGKSEITSNDEKWQIVKKEKEVGERDFWSNYPFFRRSFDANGICPSLSMPEGVRDFMKEKMSSIGSIKAKDLEEKWKDLFKKETELYFERLNLMREQTKLALGM
ncbi:STOREKEEPER protein [Abeliophyllum distichum]|uniref:STOREKEEPER protein n=1 Tax=Abeliophyllum distichum TaxID=126358 RepID=A0ABD1QFG0_9LAMI